MSQPAPSEHLARYGAGTDQAAPDGRLFSQVFLRNNPPMVAALAPWLAGARGEVLEIAAGTGQHAAAFSLAFPQLTWRASDPDPDYRRSCAAWRAYLGLPDLDPLDLDASTDWSGMAAASLRAVMTMNVTHIAPIAVTHGILRGAARCLAPGGQLFIYGPFMANGVHTSDGNRAFDAQLRQRDPALGLRDIAEIETLARVQGLGLAATLAMPANNKLLVLEIPRRR